MRSHSPTRKPGGGCWLALDDVDDREARIRVEAGGGEEGGDHVSVEERVAAAVRRGDPLGLGEGVHSEAALTLEPARAGPPDQLGTGEQEVLVEMVPGAAEMVPGAADDTGRAGCTTANRSGPLVAARAADAAWNLGSRCDLCISPRTRAATYKLTRALRRPARCYSRFGPKPPAQRKGRG